MQSPEIRRRFLDFFTSRGHREVPSSSLVPTGDDTLLFTNAGMVQFKRVFTGQETRDFKRAVTVQKCVRAGGKHNDLEQVGHTDRHLTFFEMLGNFSFGDYFKQDAIAFAWEFVTSKAGLGIDPDCLRVTVHETDDEARRLWRELTGMTDERIFSLGDDNFWRMADTGPCGPCSEIFVDLDWKPGSPRGTESTADFVRMTDAGRFVEIWNLVFMQYNQQADGSMPPLPAPSVDTGAGLDRIAGVLQGQTSVFHSDIFAPLLDRVAQVIGAPYDRGEAGAPYRVLADHARAVAFLLADGVYPSNEGRGYVLRRILRRAVRHAYLLGRREPTLVELVDVVINQMGGVYPQLVENRQHLRDVTRSEEERFLETIEGGLVRLAELTTVSGEDAFKLYDTYGFPIDLTQVIADERKMSVDVPGFEKLLDEQRERSRADRRAVGRKGGRAVEGADASTALPTYRPTAWTRVKPRLRQKFVGYDTVRAETDVLSFQRAGDRLGLILHENPFYAESGGQVSDRGQVKGEGWTLPVDEVRKIEGRTAVFGAFDGAFEPTPVDAVVDEPRRRDTERNHTATHLVHAALRKILGTHVHQAGSVVSPDRLRFDFTHHQPIGPEQLAAIESEINQHVWENLDVTTDEMGYDDALVLGAMALFGEKYGDEVRVVSVPGVSIELCGGTHVRTTGQIGLLKFLGESGTGAGVRRIEAFTGRGAFDWFAAQRRMLEEAAARAGSTPEHLARKVEALTEERRKLEKRVEELIKGGGAAGGSVTQENGTSIAVQSTASGDRNEIGAMVDAFRSQNKSGVILIFATGERPGIHAGVTDDLVARGVTAPEVVNKVAALTGGKGGGRPHFASAGAGTALPLADAEQQAPGIVRELLAGKP